MKHKTTIDYEGGLEKLVEDIGDLHYLSLQKFFELLSKKMFKDAKADNDRNRPKLSITLHRSAVGLEDVAKNIGEAWKISEPYMK
jgi:hypothetical protein